MSGNVNIIGSGNGIIFPDGTTQKTDPSTTSANGDLIINGNLGVGTSTPTQKIDVNGNARVNGQICGTLGSPIYQVTSAQGSCSYGQLTLSPSCDCTLFPSNPQTCPNTLVGRLVAP